MASCALITSKLPVQLLVSKLLELPHLWGQVTYRQDPCGEHLSPHRDSQDIHLRYNPLDKSADHDFHTSPHIPEWYPAVAALPEVVPLVGSVLMSVCADMLGSVFLINVPKGKQIYPHVDKSWNSTYFNKYCVGVKNVNNKGVCGFEDGSKFAPADGEAWQFENDVVHWFDNTAGEDDCWMLIVNCRPIVNGVMREVFDAKAA